MNFMYTQKHSKINVISLLCLHRNKQIWNDEIGIQSNVSENSYWFFADFRFDLKCYKIVATVSFSFCSDWLLENSWWKRWLEKSSLKKRCAKAKGAPPMSTAAKDTFVSTLAVVSTFLFWPIQENVLSILSNYYCNFR